jgi:hypothetical protein
MVLIRSGKAANFAVWIWRCSTCEAFRTTTRRFDGKRFWVGAMGRAVVAKIDELMADAYAPPGPT